MRYEIVTFRYNNDGTSKAKFWDMTNPKDVTNFRRYFKRNSILGYQYDIISNTPMIRFNSVHAFTRHEMFALDNGHCDSCGDSTRFFTEW